MKKIISLVWYKVLPPLFGGQKGIAHFNQHLARYIRVVCVCSSDNVVQEELPYEVLPVLPPGKKHIFNPFYWSKLKQIAKKENASAIILEHPYHGIAAWLAARATGARLIVHSHNIESNRFRQIGKWWWPLLLRYEKWVHRRASLNLFKTQEDQEWAIRQFHLSPGKCMIIPYGVERPLLQTLPQQSIREQYGILPGEKLLLFAGTLDYEPNADAVKSIYSEIAPRLRSAGLKFRILICGRNRFPAFQYLHQLVDPSVIMAGEVPSIAPYFMAADVFINPVLSGGGIQTKNLDAIAHGCNAVCFGSQATGIPADVCGTKLRTATSGNWDIFTAQIIGAAEKSEPTPDNFFSYFDWDRILQPLIHNLQTHE
jgi:glycosyltransferase involved in cell wall biosynthesis